MNWVHAMRASAFALFLCLPSLAAAQQPQYSPYTNQYEYAPEGATPQFHTRSGGSLSALAKLFNTFLTPINASMALKEPCLATIPTRSSKSLSALIGRSDTAKQLTGLA